MGKEGAGKVCTMGERTTAGKGFVSGEGYAAARRWVRFVQLHYAVNAGVSESILAVIQTLGLHRHIPSTQQDAALALSRCSRCSQQAFGFLR